MCLIVIKPKGRELPQDKYLEEGYKRNKDGIGIAFWKNDSNYITIKKGFKTVEKLIKFLKLKIKPEDSLIIHFRKATSGLEDDGNCHPFPVTTDPEIIRKSNLKCDLALAHNGVISHYGSDKVFSDTQEFILKIFAQEIVRQNWDKSPIKELIQGFIGSDRLAIMKNNGDVCIFGTYYKEDGIYFSNNGYKPIQYNYNYWSGYYGYGNYQYGNYGNYNNKEHKSTETKKKDEKKDDKIVPFTDYCDGCGQFKSGLLSINYKKEWYLLCKACRRDLSNKKLILPANEGDSYSTGVCAVCLNTFKSEMLDENRMCPTCSAIYSKA